MTEQFSDHGLPYGYVERLYLSPADAYGNTAHTRAVVTFAADGSRRDVNYKHWLKACALRECQKMGEQL